MAYYKGTTMFNNPLLRLRMSRSCQGLWEMPTLGDDTGSNKNAPVASSKDVTLAE